MKSEDKSDRWDGIGIAGFIDEPAKMHCGLNVATSSTIPSSKGVKHAGTGRTSASDAVQTAREEAHHAGRGVRAGRNAAHSRGEARRSFDEASDCHRTFQGPADRCQAASAETRANLRADETPGSEGLSQGSARSEPQGGSSTRTRHPWRFTTGRTGSGVTPGLGATGSAERSTAARGLAIEVFGREETSARLKGKEYDPCHRAKAVERTEQESLIFRLKRRGIVDSECRRGLGRRKRKSHKAIAFHAGPVLRN